MTTRPDAVHSTGTAPTGEMRPPTLPKALKDAIKASNARIYPDATYEKYLDDLSASMAESVGELGDSNEVDSATMRQAFEAIGQLRRTRDELRADMVRIALAAVGATPAPGERTPPTCATCKHSDRSAQYPALFICAKGIRSLGVSLRGEHDRYLDEDFGCTLHEPVEAPPPAPPPADEPTPLGATGDWYGDACREAARAREDADKMSRSAEAPAEPLLACDVDVQLTDEPMPADAPADALKAIRVEVQEWAELCATKPQIAVKTPFDALGRVLRLFDEALRPEAARDTRTPEKSDA